MQAGASTCLRLPPPRCVGAGWRKSVSILPWTMVPSTGKESAKDKTQMMMAPHARARPGLCDEVSLVSAPEINAIRCRLPSIDARHGCICYCRSRRQRWNVVEARIVVHMGRAPRGTWWGGRIADHLGHWSTCTVCVRAGAFSFISSCTVVNGGGVGRACLGVGGRP